MKWRYVFSSLIFLPIIVGLGACSRPASSHLDDTVRANTKPKQGAAETISHALPTGAAAARLPKAAGAIRRVLETRHYNGIDQRITLANDKSGFGENFITIAVQTAPETVENGKVPVWKPGDHGIRQELLENFSNISMQILNDRFRSNRYGNFNVAIGRTDSGRRCIYAWQYVADMRSLPDGDRIEGNENSPGALRIKLCREDTSIDDLVQYVEELEIDLNHLFDTNIRVASESAKQFHLKNRLVYRKRRFHRTGHRPRPAGLVQSEKPEIALKGPLRYLAPLPHSMSTSDPHISPMSASPLLPPQAYQGPNAAKNQNGTSIPQNFGAVTSYSNLHDK